MVSNKQDIKTIIIIIIIFAIIFQIYNITYKSKYGDPLTKMKISKVPYELKCAFEEPGCEEGDIDGWTLMHGLMYFIIGLIVPNKYLIIFVISILWEIIQPLFGNNARYIINPLVNLTGYGIGSIVKNSLSKNQLREKYTVLL